MVTRLERSRSSFISKGLVVPTAEKLAGVAETTALRRGRTDTVDSIFNPPPVQSPPPYMPHIEPSLPDPVLPLLQCAADEILSGGSCMKKPQQVPAPTPAPSPFVPVAPPPPPQNPFVSIGSDVFYSEKEYIAAKKKLSPCGNTAPYAVENTGLMRSFCTYADFLAAGYHQSVPVPPSTRGKLCPKGQTYWGGKCKTITFSESTFL